MKETEISGLKKKLSVVYNLYTALHCVWHMLVLKIIFCTQNAHEIRWHCRNKKIDFIHFAKASLQWKTRSFLSFPFLSCPVLSFPSLSLSFFLSFFPFFPFPFPSLPFPLFLLGNQLREVDITPVYTHHSSPVLQVRPRSRHRPVLVLGTQRCVGCGAMCVCGGLLLSSPSPRCELEEGMKAGRWDSAAEQREWRWEGTGVCMGGKK